MTLTDAKRFITYNYLGSLTYLDRYEIKQTLQYELTKKQQQKIMEWLKDLAKIYYEKIKQHSYYNNFDEFFENTNWGLLYTDIKQWE